MLIIFKPSIKAADSGGTFYYPQLDGLRAIAFLMVFCSHAGGFVVSDPSAPLYTRGVLDWINSLMFLGTINWSGVDLFFVLSAFLITSILLNEETRYGNVNLRLFVIRRALRIWPLYYFVTFIGLTLFPFLTNPSIAVFGSGDYFKFMKIDIVWMATFTLNFGISLLIMSPPALLGPLWSVSMEEQFYLFWGLTFRFLHRHVLRISLVLFLLPFTLFVRYYLRYTYPMSHIPYYMNTLSRLDPIIFGILIAYVRFYWPSWFAPRWILPGLSLAAAYLLFHAGANMGVISLGPDWTVWGLTVIDLGCGFFLVAALTFKPLAWLLSRTYIGHFGRRTYGMYLFHAIVVQGLNALVYSRYGLYDNHVVRTALNYLIGLPLTYLLATAAWHLVERRFLLAKERFSPICSGFHHPRVDTAPLVPRSLTS